MFEVSINHKMKTSTHIIIAVGGYLPSPKVEKIVITDQDEEFLEEDWESFDEYEDYLLREAVAEYNQRFATAIAMTETQFQSIKEEEV
jgi:hypothetical protein